MNSCKIFSQFKAKKSEEISLVMFLDKENLSNNTIIDLFESTNFIQSIGLDASLFKKIHFVTVFAQHKHRDAAISLQNKYPQNSFFVQAETSCKDAADFQIVHLATGLHFILPENIPFVFVSNDHFVDEISPTLANLGRKTYLSNISTSNDLKEKVTDKIQVDTKLTSNTRIAPIPPSDPDKLSVDELRKYFIDRWIVFEGKTRTSFTREHNIDQSNFAKWINGKKPELKQATNAVRQWIISLSEKEDIHTITN